MDYTLSEWLNLAARWFHVFAGILWIGQTYFFTWLDGCLSREHEANPTDRAEVWMVHSGGFYVVGKQTQPALSRTLHWFRWEAALTWVSGMVLLVLVYYMGGVMVDATVAGAGSGTAIGLGLTLLGVSWLVYDVLWQSPLGRSVPVGAAISFVLVVASAYGLTRAMSGRAAYIHVGAMLGTIMAANVWMRILPAQRQMIATTRAGGTPDATMAARAKLRSKHNTYMAVPVVFIMVSNHFPVATYGHPYNWLVLTVLIVVGAGVAGVLRRM